MKKRLFSIITALALCLSLLPATALAYEDPPPVTIEAAIEGTTGASSNEGYSSLVDGKYTEADYTKWCVTNFSGAYVIFKAKEAAAVSGYSITTGNDNAEEKGRNPKSWTLYGSNATETPGKGSEGWVKIHSVTNDTVLQDENFTTYDYAFDMTTTAYQYFKLEITANQGAAAMQMSEFTLTSCDHTGDGEITLATCTTKGYETYICTTCGRQVFSNETAPLGHAFGEDETCTRCGEPRDELYTFNISQGSITIKDDDDHTGKLLVLYGDGLSEWNIDPSETITVTGTTSGNSLVVAASKSVTIKASNLTINNANIEYRYAMALNSGANVTLILEGENTFKGGKDKSGIVVGTGSTLTIEGTGSVTAQGGTNVGGAGIGGDGGGDCGTIIINSGTVNATGGFGGAGIGGGRLHSGSGAGGGTIIINGGTVTARGGSGAADIGGGSGTTDNGTLSGSGDAVITATNNNVTANTDYFAGTINGITYVAAVNYGVTVNGTKVNSANADDVLSGSNAGKVSYNADTNTLTITDLLTDETSAGIPAVIQGNGSTDIVLRSDDKPATYDLTVTGAKDVTVTATASPAISGSAEIACTGDVTITSESSLAVSGNSFKVTAANNVTLRASGSAPTINTSIAEIACSGNVEITNSGSGSAMSGSSFKVTAAKDVTLGAVGSAPTITTGGAEITCSGNVSIASEQTQAVSGPLTVKDANNVVLRTAGDSYTVSSPVTIACRGDITIENTTTSTVSNPCLASPLTVTKANNVTVSTNTSAPVINAYAAITCDGNVSIVNKNTSGGYGVQAYLTVSKAQDVTVSAYYTAVSGTTNITCYGTVQLSTANTSVNAVSSLITFNQLYGDAYTVYTGDSLNNLTELNNPDFSQPISAAAVKIVPVPHVHSMTHVAAVPATCSATGTAEYWQCGGCQKIFADAAGETELTAPTVLPIDPNAHVFSGSTCTLCGYTRPSTGSSSGSGSNTTTTTEKNEDGSTTTTVTDKTTGTVTETTKNTDGSTTVVETKRDGAVTETKTTADGTTGTVVTDKDGDVTEVKASVSATAAKEAGKTGGAVTLPVEVPSAKNTADAPAVEITLPVSSSSAKVEIPVEKVTPGTVAVLVKADGTEKIVKNSVPTENGVALALTGSFTVKVVDNSKVYSDVQLVKHWASDAVDFVSARELFTGTSATTYNPDGKTNRAMLMTSLARLDNVDTTGGATWYEKGQKWAVSSGISDGSNPEDLITREQVAVMLWRYAGSPKSSHSLENYSDADQISNFALEAMCWANEKGIINGYGNGLLGAKDNASRAETSQMLANYIVKSQKP